MEERSLKQLREKLQRINFTILEQLNQRARVINEVLQIKTMEKDIPLYVPEREKEMLGELVAKNRGPFSDETIEHFFKEIFRASVALMETRREKTLKISRAYRKTDLTISVGGYDIGKSPIAIAGPCAVESEEQMDSVGRELVRLGVRFLRGGTEKPRSSPYSFQGLGELGLKILKKTAKRYNLISVTEVMDTRTVGMVSQYADILQIGSRNMYNYPLLREVGRIRKPVLLKRGFAATIDEFLWAAEYIVSEGNKNVILCERGIRTFERKTRNTLDISAIPLIKQISFLPVIVDVSHAAGRKDILASLGRSALASGADGLMVEVHPFPAVARSDSRQQLDFAEFTRFLDETGFINSESRFHLQHFPASMHPQKEITEGKHS